MSLCTLYGGFKGFLKRVSKLFKERFKDVSRVLKVYCVVAVITPTRAEGGLVDVQSLPN